MMRTQGAVLVRLAMRAWQIATRVAAWALVPLMLMQFLSGYAILHPRVFGAVVGKATAFRLHTALQPFTVAAFALHGLPWVARRVTRPGSTSRWAVGILLTFVGFALVALSAYLRLLG